MRHVPACGYAALVGLVSGCSVTRPVPVALDAPSLEGYLAEHPAANLRVSDQSGRRYWVHRPEVRGNFLVGRLGFDVPVRPVEVELRDVAELRTGHFSLGRTAAAVGGAVVVAGLALALLIENAQPVD